MSTGEFLLLPEEAPATWVDIFTNARLEAKDRKLSIDEILRDFPVSVIKPNLSLEAIHGATGGRD
jgi:maltooligosyltrehalose synthase